MARALALSVVVAASTALGAVGCQTPPPSPPPAAEAAPIDERATMRRALADDLAQRYARSPAATHQIVYHAFEAAAEFELDPLLVLAVIGVESRFDPDAANASGAKGLMQVIPRFHLRRLAAHGGERAVLEPAVNIRVGTAILAEYIARAGSETAGLRRYVGAEDGPYARKVLAERARLRALQARVDASARPGDAG